MRRRVLLGSVDVYCWEDEGRTHMEAYDLHKHKLFISGRPVVLVDPAADEQEVASTLEDRLPMEDLEAEV